jgi:hypothetical protein
MNYLEKLSSSEEVALFVERLEQAIQQQELEKQGKDKNKNPIPFIRKKLTKLMRKLPCMKKN